MKVEVTVWAYWNFSVDALDLYTAADASNPAWSLLTTLVPSAAKTQVLSASYTLPSGPLQAVRAAFRHGGTPSPCAAGNYNDRDDLVFAVSAP